MNPWLWAIAGGLVGCFIGFTWTGSLVMQNLTPDERERFFCRVRARSPSLRALCEPPSPPAVHGDWW